MLTFLDFVLLIILVAVLTVVLFLATGIVYNQKGSVSVIVKGKKFYKIEDRPFSYYFPIVFRKVGYYPLEPREYKIDKDHKITLYVKDVKLLYENKVNIKKLLKQNKNLEETLKKYKIIVKK
ncbi:MAG: hypothetical protein MJ199_02700 [Bacilli bacterium]|nr:hypothetical protein [Bacilli bacterium]